MTKELSNTITHLLNGTIASVKTILPFPINVTRPTLFSEPIIQKSMGVLIGLTGDVLGRVIIVGDEELFMDMSEKMYGMKLAGDMLESFSGELGNIIVGNLITNMSKNGLNIDITPPTVLVGETKISGFDKALKLPLSIDHVGGMDIILILENS
ncbi:chemotaxis protein CheX [Fervidibacillus halotolerans]|uniref:Chemotaxis protein CheX n=1 Tax=Fervidibacillus halotolerans TaxID=2980027 RepID=A0A9E8M120_9BACI|nr:chemotaxis protein CheX [Fervidibacillus halotolerans]WAA13264.1 chemotaxis protein CheX [Fervidibacillus halotolerans]